MKPGTFCDHPDMTRLPLRVATLLLTAVAPLRAQSHQLNALRLEPMHGWGITERIEQWSEQVLLLGQGSLYPALYRLERQGLIGSEWKITENSRRARHSATPTLG
jgi:hypothetical protein